MQVWAVPQSVLTWHWGATSWAVTQYPIWHTLPDDPTQQSSFEKQGVRQTASTQTSSVTCTPTQSTLARHWGCAPVLGWQMPDTQMSCAWPRAAQSAVVAQSAWQ